MDFDLHAYSLLAGWLVGGVITFLSLGPEGARPHVLEPAVERFVAYFCLGLLFALAYPAQPVLVAIGVAAYALILEASQYAIPNRHARLLDARDGALGGFLGVVLGAVVPRLWVFIPLPRGLHA